ncbi:thioredoxin family protein (plasmid) [Bacillus subtilis]|uniref:thioredoxin family protein n=1 Tax=Bacillus TaxID=1386 RepID=UPI0005B664B2|nr:MULTISPECIES: thioredoxin family protein [Bacillus]AJO60862.1 hypothetical protein QF06_20625 [Bacillus sp. YP1]KAA0930082.1 thioredoxin family protein [Bacillus sp. ANT_WA51]MBW9315158.1 thioredoxin family protein [Bacillus subtilis]MDI6582339.1 thioredoxin family protein [Bacillus subtilis]MDI6591113.1 thioredoxin family protein [Bacillus subtilis]
MVKVIWIYKVNDPLNDFLERQINAADLQGSEFEKVSIDEHPELIEEYEIEKTHTLVFFDREGDRIANYDGPFNSKELEESIKVMNFFDYVANYNGEES